MMNQEQSIRFLRDYGVDELHTPEDDPSFWAMVLARSWPTAEELAKTCVGTQPSTWLFGICSLQPRCDELGNITPGWFPPKEWALLCLAGQLFPSERYSKLNPWFSLSITRPSLGVNDARVEIGAMFGPLCGEGCTANWQRQPDGIWVEKSTLRSWVS